MRKPVIKAAKAATQEDVREAAVVEKVKVVKARAAVGMDAAKVVKAVKVAETAAGGGEMRRG